MNPLYPYPTDARLGPTSIAIAHAEATKRTEEVTSIARGIIATPTPTRLPTVIHPLNVTGIIQGTLTPPDDFPFRQDAEIENYWRDFPESNAFIIVAGNVKGDPRQGFVGVATYKKIGYVALNKSPTPSKNGSVHIIAVNGFLVTLVAKDGTTFVFDYETYTFK